MFFISLMTQYISKWAGDDIWWQLIAKKLSTAISILFQSPIYYNIGNSRFPSELAHCQLLTLPIILMVVSYFPFIEKYDDLKLPTRVIVEMKPKDMGAFLKVQSMAQNPRIRVALALQKRLSSLITCVSQRWKNSEAVAVSFVC